MKEDKVQDIISLMQKLNAEEKDRLSSRLSQLGRETEMKSLLEKIVTEAQRCLDEKYYSSVQQLSITTETIENLVNELKRYHKGEK